MTDPNPNPVDGPVEILIVTYWKDQPWLDYALRCIQKHCRGFQGVTVCTPHPAMRGMTEKFIPPEWFDQFNGPIPIRVNFYDEIPGKGMVQHMVKMGFADEVVPPGTKYILTCDSDCMFKMYTTPEHYFHNDKPYYIYRSWESLGFGDPHSPNWKPVSDNLQWKGPTDRQIGFPSEIFGMCMNTVVFPIDFFPVYRSHIRSVHNRAFADVILAGQNEFPTGSMDFTAMGAYAYRFMRDRFHWFDCMVPPYPADRKQAYHSHSGLKPEVLAEINSFLT